MLPIVVKRNGHGFGDRLLAALLALVLRDHGVDAYRVHKYPCSLVDCPEWHGRGEHQGYGFRYRHTDKTMLSRALADLTRITDRPIRLTRKFIPVHYREMAQVPAVDVAICSECGSFSRYRAWPYFEELKARFRAAGVSYVDLNEAREAAPDDGSMTCLNYVRKARLYLGLDTGTSHLVSQWARGKTLILQSGFNRAV